MATPSFFTTPKPSAPKHGTRMNPTRIATPTKPLPTPPSKERQKAKATEKEVVEHLQNVLQREVHEKHKLEEDTKMVVIQERMKRERLEEKVRDAEEALSLKRKANSQLEEVLAKVRTDSSKRKANLHKLVEAESEKHRTLLSSKDDLLKRQHEKASVLKEQLIELTHLHAAQKAKRALDATRNSESSAEENKPPRWDDIALLEELQLLVQQQAEDISALDERLEALFERLQQ